jgi:hypothetical protein
VNGSARSNERRNERLNGGRAHRSERLNERPPLQNQPIGTSLPRIFARGLRLKY